MIIDIHTRIAAALHIVTGVIGAAIMLIGVIGVNGLAAMLSTGSGADAGAAGFLFGFGNAVLAILMLTVVAEIAAGVALLRGSPTGRVFVIVFSVFCLFKFPFGTAMGAYCLWALLRKQPVSGATVTTSARP